MRRIGRVDGRECMTESAQRERDIGDDFRPRRSRHRGLGSEKGPSFPALRTTAVVKRSYAHVFLARLAQRLDFACPMGFDGAAQAADAAVAQCTRQTEEAENGAAHAQVVADDDI
eukprot:4234920-Pleurochrysis_carterae.AAC.1